ncbi:DUF2785 domain-containing protein [Bacillus sp. 2205SS5-2]|uniref:DUF2785 domain-containing protein n=1 Tax=Bacillus sp. 2205SS5-2 TaxID=3109031 RepID=UPI0030053EE7
MQDQLRLESELNNLLRNDTVPGEMDHFIELMLLNIGSTNAELRDHLIYSSFCKLISQGFLTSKQMKHIVKTCLDEKHLFFGLGTNKDDSVFTRSFSSLVIAIILKKDRQDSFLPEELANRAIATSWKYLQKEEDVRGFVDGKGWAHSVAHGADYLQQAVLHPLFDKNDVGACLEAMETCLFNEYAYIDDEDERLIFPIEALLEIGVDGEIINNWVKGISARLATVKKEEPSLVFFRKKVNILAFYKTLYFRILYRNRQSKLRDTVEIELEKWHKNIYH